MDNGEQDNRLGERFSGWGLIRYALPNIVMLVFSSLYTIVDALFVTRLVNTMAVGSLNIVYPAMSFFMAFAFMFATGGSAIVARQMGQGRNQDARENFTFITVAMASLSLVIGALCLVHLETIMTWLGASELQFEQCCDYGRIVILCAPLMSLQFLFQVFFVTAGHPTFGLVITTVAGVANMVLDYVFMGPLDMGISGAALATVIGYAIVAVTGVVFFLRNRKEPLHFAVPRVRWRILRRTVINGSSEMVSNIAAGITTLLYNYYFMRFYAEDGVSSISIVLYIQFIFVAVLFGYCGIAPIISYKYGHRDLDELRGIVRFSLCFVGGFSIVIYALSLFTIDGLLLFFVTRDDPVFEISREGFPWFAPSILFMGVSIFASCLFTALSDGKTSALISFGRTLVFLVVCIIYFSEEFGVRGAWGSISVAEFLGFVVSLCYLLGYRREIASRTGRFSAQELESPKNP